MPPYGFYGPPGQVPKPISQPIENREVRSRSNSPETKSNIKPSNTPQSEKKNPSHTSVNNFENSSHRIQSFIEGRTYGGSENFAPSTATGRLESTAENPHGAGMPRYPQGMPPQGMYPFPSMPMYFDPRFMPHHHAAHLGGFKGSAPNSQHKHMGAGFDYTMMSMEGNPELQPLCKNCTA